MRRSSIVAMVEEAEEQGDYTLADLSRAILRARPRGVAVVHRAFVRTRRGEVLRQSRTTTQRLRRSLLLG